MFGGFPEETIRFFLGLRFHNDATYFNAHRNEYEAYVKEPFFEFIRALAPTLEEIADDFELRPDKCLARIRRDTRFTKDKTPYRDHLWLMFKRSGEPRDETVMFWFELSPDTVNWGLGFWGPNRPTMDALRTMIAEKPAKVTAALKQARIPDKGFSIDGERYQRIKIPESVPKELKELYTHKSLYLCRQGISLTDAYSGHIVELCAQDYLRLKPLYKLFRELADTGKAALEG
ncbi:MAG: DUF2461 domain-containing protein [Bacillota bacterium]